MTSPRIIKFLLVDDLDANLLALEGLLKRDGLELLKARSGSEALELLLVHDFALALIDVQMPGMSGFELAEIMRGTERTRSVPIIFLTAGVVDQQRRIRGYETGAVDFLPKPIEPANLLNKAATFFDLARQREELRQSETLLRDANEQLAQRNAELARADKSKDEFLAMLAHELRNPLAPLRNATEILQSPEVSLQQREHALQLISRQIENMNHMINDLLDVSRITEGKIELRCKTVELKPILLAVADTAEAACRNAHQQLIVSLPEEPIFINGDTTRLEQIFGNLIGNACKYSGDGSRISMTAEVVAAEVVVRVSDNGVGISPELLPHVFDLFVQASRTLDRAHGGLGIGLTIVHRLVKLHEGSIEAHSQGLGHGTEFIVRFPLVKNPQKEAAAPALSADGGRALKMLIVDDNKDSAETMAMLQELDGHETRVALTGPDAVTVAAEFLPEVVLLDIGLPGMDGFEVARKLRTMPALQHTFLIALTGYGTHEDRSRAEEAGFNEHLVKPANLEHLRTLLMNRS